MSSFFRLPIQCGSEVSWLFARLSLSKRAMRTEIQMVNQMLYPVKFLSWLIESGTELSWLLRRVRLSNRTMRIEIK